MRIIIIASICMVLAIACYFLSKRQLETCEKADHNAFSANYIDTTFISSELKKISKDFIDRFEMHNGNIEVSIDKREPLQIVINFACRGITDFKVRDDKPSLVYKIGNTYFFVYTGAEELFNIKLNEKYGNQQSQDKCMEEKKACYVLDNHVVYKEDNCGIPFSSLKPISVHDKRYVF